MVAMAVPLGGGGGGGGGGGLSSLHVCCVDSLEYLSKFRHTPNLNGIEVNAQSSLFTS